MGRCVTKFLTEGKMGRCVTNCFVTRTTTLPGIGLAPESRPKRDN